MKTGLEPSTLTGIHEEESDKKYVGQIKFNTIIFLYFLKENTLLWVHSFIVVAGSLFRGWNKVNLKVSPFVSGFNLLQL